MTFLFLIAAVGLAIWALAQGAQTGANVAVLRREIAGLRRNLDVEIRRLRLETGLDEAPPAVEPETPDAAAPTPVQPSAPDGDAFAPPPPPPPAPPPVALPAASLEDRLTSRWLVWLGALALALGGFFLVKYSLEHGTVLPGGILGLALTSGGEWMRQRARRREGEAARPGYGPQALTAAGLFTTFATVYVGFAYYSLIPSALAVILLAGIAVAAVALSVLHGPFVAILGVTGGFLTPMLVPSQAQWAWGLFAYLAVLTATALAIVRYKGWKWLGWTALAGAAGWPMLWFATVWNRDDAGAVAIYILTLAGLFQFYRWDWQTPEAPPTTGMAARLRAWLDRPEFLTLTAATAITGLTFTLLRVTAYGWIAVTLMIVLCALYLYAGRRNQALDALPFAAATLAAASMGAWHFSTLIGGSPQLDFMELQRHTVDPGFVAPPDIPTFLLLSLLVAGLFGVWGFAAMWGARQPARWAGVAACVPVALLAIAYWRILEFEVDFIWGTVAVMLAAIYVGAAARVEARRRDGPGYDDALGLFAAAAVAALALAAAMTLRQAWLTVSLAAMLPALAWIHGHLRVESLRRIAAVVAAAVFARLALNLYIADYPLGGLPGVNWILYGYGLPAAAFFVAARMFRRDRDDWLIMLLEAGAILFAVLLVTLEIRTLIAGSVDGPDYSLLEQSAQTIAWVAAAYALMLRNRGAVRAVPHWAARILLAMAALNTAGGALLVSNPLWTGDPVGTWPVFNLLFLAYLVPGVFALLLSKEFGRSGERTLAALTGGAGLLLAFLFVTLQVTHLFHGPVLWRGETTVAEWYAYSAAWLAFAGGLLAAGVRTGSVQLRHASLGLVFLTVAKVFLFDMSELEDLWRVASFLGLGLALVGIGLAYRRWVFPPEKAAEAGAAGTAEA